MHAVLAVSIQKCTGTPYGLLCFEGDDALVEGVVYEKWISYKTVNQLYKSYTLQKNTDIPPNKNKVTNPILDNLWINMHFEYKTKVISTILI